MALDITNFYQLTAPNYKDVSTGASLVLSDASYVTTVDNLATVKGANYFAQAVSQNKLRAGDLINVSASDGFALLRYLANGTIRTFTEA